MTSLAPECACSADKACQLRDHSYILGSCDGVTCLYVGGMVSKSYIGQVCSYYKI